MPLPHISGSEPSGFRRASAAPPCQREHEDEAVGADAEVPVTDGDGESRPVTLAALRFEKDEVVARAVHLDEVHHGSRSARSRVI